MQKISREKEILCPVLIEKYLSIARYIFGSSYGDKKKIKLLKG